ncbi:MAG: VWA domain-containing protein [Clostridium sp.]|nr:VWA domain-containing protein [Clostridium sp.]
MRRKSRKSCLILVLVLSLILCQRWTCYKVNAKTVQKSLHVVFALDVSGSMNNKDANKSALEIVKMLNDICSYSGNELGFVAYNDTIAYSHDMVLCKEEESEKLKDYVRKVQYGGETDIGLGLKTAVQMSSEHVSEDSDSIVILLSDGKTDLAKSETKRTLKDSQRDMDDALKLAQEKNITVYPVRLNDKFDTKVDYLSQVAKSTNGVSSVAFSPLELVDIIQSIVSRYQVPDLETISTLSGNGDLQEVKIDLETKYVDKTRIYVLSTDKVSYVSLVGADAEITYNNTKRYCIAEISDMENADSVKLYFRGKKKSEIQVYVQQYHSLEPVIQVEDRVSRDDSKNVLLQFYDRNAQRNIVDQAFFEELQVQCNVVSLKDGSQKGLSYVKTEDGIALEGAFSQIGDYELEISYSGKTMNGMIHSDKFQVISREPEILNDVEENICLNKKAVDYRLSEMFHKVKNNIDEYLVESVEGNSVKYEISGDILSCMLEEPGDTVLIVQALDEEQDLHQITMTIHCKTFWQMYQVIIVGCAIGAIMLIALILGLITVLRSKQIRKKSSAPFAGTLIGYFVNLKSMNDLPALKWNLYNYTQTSISMTEMLQDIGIPDRFVGADKIWFYSKSENSIELMHNLEGSIFIGTKMVSKNTPVTIYSGEKIFISFDESGIELELRYSV